MPSGGLSFLGEDLVRRLPCPTKETVKRMPSAKANEPNRPVKQELFLRSKVATWRLFARLLSIAAGNGRYRAFLHDSLRYHRNFTRIPLNEHDRSSDLDPFWLNEWFSALDA